MSKSLSFLLRNLSSDEAKRVTIEELATGFFRGSGITKQQIGSGDFPCVRYGELYTTYDVWFDKCVSTINPSLIKKPKYIEYGDVIVVSISENVKDIGRCCVYLGKEQALIGDNVFVFKHNQNPKYLSYALSSNSAQKQKIKLAKHCNISSITWEDFKKIKIPLPSLEVQKKVSEVLDYLRFSKKELMEQLEKEIESREKQYGYYSSLLISLGGGLILDCSAKMTLMQTSISKSRMETELYV